MTEKNNSVSVKQIVEDYLRKHNYTGLLNFNNSCGCDLDDLACCGNEGIEDCHAGYKRVCTDCSEDERENCEIRAEMDCDFCIHEEKQKIL